MTCMISLERFYLQSSYYLNDFKWQESTCTLEYKQAAPLNIIINYRGLCGIFDGDMSNELHDLDGMILPVKLDYGQADPFVQQWRY